MKITRRRAFGLLAGAAAAIGGGSIWASLMKTYAGPISDHFDGTRFHDPDGSTLKNPLHILKWVLDPNRPKWPDWVPSPYSDTPPPQVEGDKARFSYVGHASWLVQTASLNILVDPIWSERAGPFGLLGPKRVNDPGIAFDKLPPIDVVLVSHAHYDHLDMPTLAKLAAKFSPRVITPLGNDLVMTSANANIRAEGFDWDTRVEIGNGVAVTLVRTRHWSARGLFDRNKTLWASFVLETPAGKIYIVCDSGYGEGRLFRRVKDAHGAIRLAILPIGAYEPRWFLEEQHMNPEESVKAMQDCGAQQALANHYGTFKLTDELVDQPPRDLAAARDDAKIAREKFLALKPGQTFEI